jgi:signal transduction histidine kinase
MANDDSPDDVLQRYNALGQLSAGVGHHVINAFAAIVSNAEIMRLTSQMPNPVDPASVADLIVKTAVEASSVARRLIDYSRSATAIGSDLVALDKLAAAVADAEQSSGREGIEWRLELVPVPPIRGNEAQLRAMLDHLIANALEALPERGGTVTLATGQDDRGWVILEVRDSGGGVTPEIQERAVEPFYTTKPGHLGVGLSIANGIWRRHRGTLALKRAGGESCVRLCVEPEGGARRPGPGKTE